MEAFSAQPYGFNDSDVRSLNLLAELILAAMKPEEENRLGEISQRLVADPAVESLAGGLQGDVVVARDRRKVQRLKLKSPRSLRRLLRSLGTSRNPHCALRSASC
jgi:hypothetical protein